MVHGIKWNLDTSASIEAFVVELIHMMVLERRWALLHRNHAVTCLHSTTIVTAFQHDALALCVFTFTITTLSGRK
jgi:uncharacterized protein with von Willebrand factor type A (vWA) domain